MAHLKLFGFPVEPMAKYTFCFVIGVLAIVDVVQSHYRNKLMRQRAAELESGAA